MPGKIMTDTLIHSIWDAEDRGLSCGIKRPTGHGNRLLILAMIGDNGLVKDSLKIWIRIDKNKRPLSMDYHHDIDFETVYNWMESVLKSGEIPPGSVISYDNATVHGKRVSFRHLYEVWEVHGDLLGS